MSRGKLFENIAQLIDVSRRGDKTDFDSHRWHCAMQSPGGPGHEARGNPGDIMYALVILHCQAGGHGKGGKVVTAKYFGINNKPRSSQRIVPGKGHKRLGETGRCVHV